MQHEISGEQSSHISAFKLPVTNQDTERRNFPGYETYSPGASLMEAVSNEGSTAWEKHLSHVNQVELKRRF